MKNHDINDWPVVATALTLNCPIWTEDKDFFGSGLPVWTTDRIHLFFKLHNRIDFSASVHEPETEYLIR